MSKSQGNVEYISVRNMHMAVVAGLRGAMAFALAYSIPVDYEHRWDLSMLPLMLGVFF